MKKEKRYAFWNYDLFPYMLWAEVDEKHSSDNKLYVPDYQGYVSNAKFVLYESTAKLLIKRLEELKRMKRIEKTALDDKYKDLLADALSDILVA